MIKASVIGATGYAGEELTRLLLRHPDVQVQALGSRSYAGQAFAEVFPNFRGCTELILREPDLAAFAKESDVVFLALPHGIASGEVTQEILGECAIIDLGADYRLKNVNIYTEWYNVEHHSPELIQKAVYGLPELHREDIKKARLIANPGCYTTCSILSLAPLAASGLADMSSIVIDAGSGVTGAGRGLATSNLYCEVNESMKAYKVASHRHTPEIEQELGLLANCNTTLNFTPHLIPMNRGILATCYITLKEKASQQEIEALYNDFYKDEYFVRFTGGVQPESKYVTGSNFTDIGLTVDERTNRVIVTGTLDNLFKGAAGQAVQNMNLLFGLNEKSGIDMIPAFPV